MMDTTSDVRDVLVVDRGPVRDAALILAESSTLAEHVNIAEDGRYVTRIEMWGDVPFALWGSGTQALWRLLCAIAYSGDTVSLYEVAARCDSRNKRAIADAIGALLR